MILLGVNCGYGNTDCTKLVAAKMTQDEADFYDPRRTCASIGLQVKDDDAVRTILGHKQLAKDMLGVYNRLQVTDDRLRAVTDHIHDWLFQGGVIPAPSESGDGQPAAPSEPAE